MEQQPVHDPADLTARLSLESARRLGERARARGQQFIRGPIPMGWLEPAARLPGKALGVAMLLWFRSGFRPRQPVSLSGNLLARFGIDRKAAYQALKGLEAQGLIRLERRRGKTALVELIRDAG